MKKAGSVPYSYSRLVSGAGRFVPVGPQALLSWNGPRGMLTARPKTAARGPWANCSTTAVRFQARASSARVRVVAGAFFARNSKDMRTVVTKGSAACGAEACTNFRVCGYSVLTRVDGMNALWGVVQIQRASNPCTAFEPIDLHGLKASALGIATYALARSKLKTILMDPDWLLQGTQIFDGGAGWGAPPRSLWRREGLTSSKILCR